MPVCEAAGEGALRVAEGRKRDRGFDTSAVVDVIGRHRLAAAAADVYAGIIRLEQVTERAGKRFGRVT